MEWWAILLIVMVGVVGIVAIVLCCVASIRGNHKKSRSHTSYPVERNQLAEVSEDDYSSSNGRCDSRDCG